VAKTPWGKKMSDCPNCEYHKESARMWRQEAQKEWVGLTDNEIALYDKRLSGSSVARDIEAKLKEKNK
jgi:hypothetical protein